MTAAKPGASLSAPTSAVPRPTCCSIRQARSSVLTAGAKLRSASARWSAYDFGETWRDDYVLDERAHDGDLGYPASVELDDGSIVTVYYQKYPDDAKCSILCTKCVCDYEHNVNTFLMKIPAA